MTAARPLPRGVKEATLAADRGWRRPLTVGALAMVLVIGAGVLIQEAVRRYHDSVALAGRSDDPTPVRMTIAGAPLEIPGNLIRSRSQRRGGIAERVDLLLDWPNLEGYSASNAENFRDGSPLAPLLYVSLLPADSPLDSDGRLDTVYGRFFIGEPLEGPSGLTGRALSPESGYGGEEVFYARGGSRKFVARCLARATPEVPATCIRDVLIGPRLTLFYRFNRFYLGDWRAMDGGLQEMVATFSRQR